MVTRIKQPAFETDDGSIFLDINAAIEHEINCKLDRLLEEHSVGRGGAWSQPMFRDFILEQQRELVAILTTDIGVECGKE
jgi:hypothetical protein